MKPLSAALLLGSALAAAAVTAVHPAEEGSPSMPEIRFTTLHPGHFHAALVQKEMYPGVSRKVDVYAPLGTDLIDHLARVSRFNTRKENPTAWELEVHTGPDFLERMCRERPGNAVVVSGRNRGKIGRLQASLDAGLHALVDKPWILEAADLRKLEAALSTADRRGLVALDIMTERFQEPGVYMESVHHLMKVVAGVPNIRPPWFFDTEQQGEGLNDIGTHLVDLVQWTLFPEQALDHRQDVKVTQAQRWPTMIPRADFKRVTGEDFPDALGSRIKDGALEYFCNTLVSYTLRDVNVTLNVIWDWEAPSGSGDSHFARYRGSLSKVEVRQGPSDQYKPALYVVPNRAADKTAVLAAVKKKLAGIQGQYPGTDVVDLGAEIRVPIPDRLQVGHEEHFAQVTRRFLQYMRDRGTLPVWERPNMLAKYYVTTEGIRLARLSPPRAAPRKAAR